MSRSRLLATQRIRSLREKKGLTQSDVSQQLELLGVKYSQARISRLERGWSEPSMSVVAALAIVLDTSVAFLLLHSDDPAPQSANHIPSSNEAREAARLVDNLLAHDRALVLAALKSLVEHDSLKRA